MENPDSSGKAVPLLTEKTKNEENPIEPLSVRSGEDEKNQILKAQKKKNTAVQSGKQTPAGSGEEDEKTCSQRPQAKNETGKLLQKKNMTDKKVLNEDKVKTTKQRTADEKKKSAKKSMDSKWILIALILTLMLSFVFSIVSELIILSAPLWVAYAVIVVLIFINVLFDIIGTAIAACDTEPFLAMAARKVRGAKKAVYLAKHANRVSSICSDIVGDVCGILSGSCGAVIVAMQFVSEAETLSMLLSIAFSAVLAAITVTGKAVGKQFAISKANSVILSVGRLLCIFGKAK